MNTHLDVLAKGLAFPEGPAFDPLGNLWCVELHGGQLVRYENGKLERHPTDGAPNGLAFDHTGRAWVCDAQQNALRRFNPATTQWQTLVNLLEGQPLSKPNDLAFDAMGNVVFTCPDDSRNEPTGYVCCLKRDGTLVRIAEGMYFPNGVAFVNQGAQLVIAETYRHRLWRGEWDPNNARWVDPAPWSNTGTDGGPDGMALGADGLLYVAVYRSGQIRAIDVRGKIVQVYDLPGRCPTNVAFDPAGHLGLIVTEAEQGWLLSMPQLGLGAPLYQG